MAQKGGKIKRFLLTLVFLALLIFVFIILGGGNLLKQTAAWLGGVGKKAENVKQSIEQKATTVEKTIEKLKEGEKPGEKK